MTCGTISVFLVIHVWSCFFFFFCLYMYFECINEIINSPRSEMVNMLPDYIMPIVFILQIAIVMEMVNILPDPSFLFYKSQS